MKALQPVIKWFGSKRPVAAELSKYFLPAKTYFEPFVGGGAMMPFSPAPMGIANDIIPELVNLWMEIKNNPNKVALEYELRWKELQAKGPEVFYTIRSHFNSTRDCYDFLFITRTCVNGMIRYNRNGEFNNGFHLSRPGIDPQRLAYIINQWSYAIRNIEFMNCDYHECLSKVKKGDFVFLDPPYGGTKDRYTHVDFNLSEFYLELERLNSIGANWMLTFDGSAGGRVYSFAPPEELYCHKFLINTGTSAFSKVMEGKREQIQESVYLNYKPINTFRTLFD